MFAPLACHLPSSERLSNFRFSSSTLIVLNLDALSLPPADPLLPGPSFASSTLPPLACARSR